MTERTAERARKKAARVMVVKGKRTMVRGRKSNECRACQKLAASSRDGGKVGDGVGERYFCSLKERMAKSL